MKIRTIIVRFLDTFSGTFIESHTLQRDVPEFASKIYGVLVNPETISREWRHLRSDTKFLRDNGYSIIEELGHKGKEKRWQIRKLNEIHRNSSRESEQSKQDNPADGVKEVSQT